MQSRQKSGIIAWGDDGRMKYTFTEEEAEYPNDYIVLVCDGAAWHKSGALKSFPNIEIMFIPPYTPEMNPIEQIWNEQRARGFHNEVFPTLEKVVVRLCDTICNLSSDTIRRITRRNWIIGCFS